MALYDNLHKQSPLTAVEFSPVSNGNFTFFYLDSPIKKAGFKEWVTSPEMGQKVMAETTISGRPVLITYGEKTKDEVMKQLEEKGDKFKLHAYKKPFPVWSLRSAFSVIGQSLQLASALTMVEQNPKTGEYVKKGLDAQFATFAIFNMMANVMNFTFGSQKSEDKNQLAYLKEQFNEDIYSHMPGGEKELINPDDKRADRHHDEKPPPTSGQKVWNFLQRNSVSVGEIGLRYAAALGLVFPMLAREGQHIGWKGMANKMMEGEFIQAFEQGLSKKKLPLLAGGLYLVGKTSALFTKVKDPYDPKPHTALDTFREDYLFKMGSAIETVAGATIAYNAFNKRKIALGKNGKVMPDYLGGIGGTLFATGYIVRMFAKFGEKKMNMEELHAHISDSLAKTPKEELPQLIADTAATLKEHFKDEPMDYGKVYSQIMTDLYRYHHVALDNTGKDAAARVAKMNELTNTTPEQMARYHGQQPQADLPPEDAKEQGAEEEQMRYADKHKSRNRMSDLASVTPAKSHVDKSIKSADEPQLTLGA